MAQDDATLDEYDAYDAYRAAQRSKALEGTLSTCWSMMIEVWGRPMQRFENPRARGWDAPPMEIDPREFHHSLPGYAATPLTSVPGIAASLGVGHVFVKDESARLGLPSFKVLGASFAIARALSQRLGDPAVLSLDELRTRCRGTGLTLVAATDGNHGRAVAHVAGMLGLAARIAVPRGVSEAARSAIVAEGAALVEHDLSYDEVVREVAQTLGPSEIMVQDTAWEGYTTIPQWIVDGYDTLAAEVDEQLAAAGLGAPDLVVVGAGVGSLAQGIINHYRRDGHRPALLVVEPDAAPSVVAALRADRVTPVPTSFTIMTGLNCGTVSELAWSAIRNGLDAVVTVDDEAVRVAVAELAALGVDAGPCGAATLAGLRAMRAADAADDANAVNAVASLGLGPASTVVLLSTEGSAANPQG